MCRITSDTSEASMANSQVSASRTEGLRSFLHKLRESSPEEFASTATSGACVDLGFTKAMFSWVDGTSWRPESVYISPDLDDRFDALIDAVDGSAVPLLRAPREADLVRYRRPTSSAKRATVRRIDHSSTFPVRAPTPLHRYSPADAPCDPPRGPPYATDHRRRPGVAVPGSASLRTHLCDPRCASAAPRSAEGIRCGP